MGDRSDIEWTDATWNPTVGCRAVSPGCDNCYAETMAKRIVAMGGKGGATYDGTVDDDGWTGLVKTVPERLEQPLRWKRPRRIFVDSMSDLFHPLVPAEFISDVFATMAAAEWHTFQLLTKRPGRMARLLDRGELVQRRTGPEWPLPNVHLGTSIESNDHAWRADHLRTAPAAVRWVSAEPLLGPLDQLDLTGIDWLVVGGESGLNARPVDPDWVRDLRDRAVAAGVPFMFKQWGGRTSKAGGRDLDGEVWDERPRGQR